MDRTLHGNEERSGEVTLQGTIICPGVALGRAFLLEPELLVSRRSIPSNRIGAEQARYEAAVQLVEGQLVERVHQIQAAAVPEAAAIVSALEAMLSDREFARSVTDRIAAEHANAEWALEQEAKVLIRLFDGMVDPYLQARGEDVRELVDSILRALAQADDTADATYLEPDKGQVIVSRHLYPRAAMQAQHAGCAAFATESMAFFAHAAILLKGFRIPSVGGLAGLSGIVLEGDRIIVDASEGIVVVRPTPETLEKHLAREKKSATLVVARPEKGWGTKDGTRVHLLANIESPEQLAFVYESGLEGVGLFRTEFLALTGAGIPSEEEQYEAYRAVITASSGRIVRIRTFDIGADKQSPTLYRNMARNPAMGTRGLRRHLDGDVGEFKTQVRAILRAAAESTADVGVLLPVVTTVEEVRQARQHIEAVKSELRASGTLYSSDVKLGVMIEVPAAAIAMKDMLAEADFTSVGTNDLLQHFMAADRDNEEVLKYNDFEHPAFVWLMRHIIDAAAAMGRIDDVTVCGEAASRGHLIRIMLRQGYRAFSIPPVALATVHEALAGEDLESSQA